MIWFLFVEGKSRSDIKEPLDDIYRESSPLMTTFKSFQLFQVSKVLNGSTSLNEVTRRFFSSLTQLQTATTAENIAKIRDLIFAR